MMPLDIGKKVQLSSPWALMPGYAISGVGTLLVVFITLLMFLDTRTNGRFIALALSLGVVVLYLRWILRRVTVKVSDEAFFLSRGSQEIEVPLAQLAEIHTVKAQTALRFAPPTAFGNYFDVSAALLSRRPKAGEALRRLREMLEARREKVLPYAASSVAMDILTRVSIDDAALISGLEEEDLNYLADHLPPYAPVRDIVLRERQRRWYG
jgi:hypothetical protein